ncbi:hypothetical protein PybrP1_008391 [[Pythium] brassicae (nom. inval.)]|nr:hypothetical protein PybrP1_008391 [[Pythium] brassicae (nom. inval.)]
MSTVCSACAERLPSTVATVQPSSQCVIWWRIRHTHTVSVVSPARTQRRVKERALAHLGAALAHGRLDREGHPREHVPRLAVAVVQNERQRVEVLADAVARVLAVDLEALALDEALHERADGRETVARLAALADGAEQRQVRHLHEALADAVHALAHEERLRRVAVETVHEHRDVDVHDVAILEWATAGGGGAVRERERERARASTVPHCQLEESQSPSWAHAHTHACTPVWDAVDDDLVHGRADRLGERAVVERRRVRAAAHNLLVHKAVDIVGRGADLHERLREREDVARERTRHAQALRQGKQDTSCEAFLASNASEQK